MIPRHACIVVIVFPILLGCGSNKNPVSSQNPPPDTTPPTFVTGPTVSDLSNGGATISWTTDEPATSVLYYLADPTPSIGTSISNLILTTDHTIRIGGDPSSYGGTLPGGTLFHYQVMSTNEASLDSEVRSGTFVTP